MAKEPQTPLDEELARQEQEAEVTEPTAEERLVEGELEGLIDDEPVVDADIGNPEADVLAAQVEELEQSLAQAKDQALRAQLGVGEVEAVHRHDDRGAGAQRRDDRQGEQQARDGEQHVDGAHDQGVDDAAEVDAVVAHQEQRDGEARVQQDPRDATAQQAERPNGRRGRCRAAKPAEAGAGA